MPGREGTTIGPYRLGRKLGEGGAGEVYLAEGPAQAGEPGQVAVKVLRGGTRDRALQETARQVHAVAASRQTHVLPVYSVGEDQGVLYVAMAYAAAGSLASTLQPETIGQVRLPLAHGVVARLVAQIARALQVVHLHGLVHGDLKLANIFVRTAPQGGPIAAVSDFGQAVVVQAAAAAASTAGSGTTGWTAQALLCAAPEQLHGKLVPATDQYALATIAYLLLTGQYPFAGDAHTLGILLLGEAPLPPTQIDPAIPPAGEAALLRGLAKAPEARYPDIGAFAQALGEGLSSGVAAAQVTQGFAELAGGGERRAGLPARGPGASGSATAGMAGVSGVRRAQAPHAGAERLIAAPRTGAPATAARRARRPLTRREWVIVVTACALVLAALAGGGIWLRLLLAEPTTGAQLPNFGGLDYAPTTTPDAQSLSRARQTAQAAEQLLAAATGTQPVFSDTLANDSLRWAVDGRQFYFGSDRRLHAVNHNPSAIASLDQPVSPPVNFAVVVDMTFVQGSYSDLAGLRVRVVRTRSAQLGYYTLLISPEGRFEIWRFDGSQWTHLDDGYAQAIKRGFGQANQLAVLAEGDNFWLYVNGHYVSSVRDNASSGLSVAAGAMGPTVIYSGTEVTYAHYAVYRAATSGS